MPTVTYAQARVKGPVRVQPTFSAFHGLHPSEARRLARVLSWPRFDLLRAGLAAVAEELPWEHPARATLDSAWWALGDLRAELAEVELEQARR